MACSTEHATIIKRRFTTKSVLFIVIIFKFPWVKFRATAFTMAFTAVPSRKLNRFGEFFARHWCDSLSEWLGIPADTASKDLAAEQAHGDAAHRSLHCKDRRPFSSHSRSPSPIISLARAEAALRAAVLCRAVLSLQNKYQKQTTSPANAMNKSASDIISIVVLHCR